MVIDTEQKRLYDKIYLYIYIYVNDFIFQKSEDDEGLHSTNSRFPIFSTSAFTLNENPQSRPSSSVNRPSNGVPNAEQGLSVASSNQRPPNPTSVIRFRTGRDSRVIGSTDDTSFSRAVQRGATTGSSRGDLSSSEPLTSADELLQTSIQFPRSSNSFIVRKLR